VKRRWPAISIALALGMLVPVGCGASSESPGAPSQVDVTVPDRPPAATADRLRRCLTPSGLTVLVGSGEGEAYAPAKEVIVTRGEGGPGAVIAVYASARDARRSLPAIEGNVAEANSRGASSSVEQHGSVTVLWIPDPPAPGDRDAVLDCLG
jgi:hypothetical protein